MEYQRELRDLGIRDYQVSGLDREKTDLPHLQDIDGDAVLKEIRLPYQILVRTERPKMFYVGLYLIPCFF